MGRLRKRALLVSGMGFFTDAYDLFVIGIVSTLLKSEWHLDTRQLAVLNAVMLGAAFLGELVLAIARRRRQAMAANAKSQTTSPRESMEAAPVITQEAHIVLADYDRLVVTHNKADDTVYVLRPPGEDPRTILRVARLVLPEDPYEELAEQLGVPASWPME